MRLLAALSLLAIATLAHAADAGTRVYAFKAFLDGKPIGEHRFTVVTEGASRRVTSDADFVVKFMGFTAYRYRHHAEEQWSGDCLASLVASTDDDGKQASVKLRKTGDANEIATAGGSSSVSGCLMTYAYWNPAMRSQARLLNPQTGKVDTVRIERVADGDVTVGGKPVHAIDWRVTGGEAPVDVWISEQGEWVGLDSVVSNGKHKLSYRLP
jgi:hypothetical protein